MSVKLLLPVLLAASPAALAAQSIADTHEQISVPGKSVVILRPLERSAAVATKCHPDATKAVACEAQLHKARVDALARRDAAQPTELSRR